MELTEEEENVLRILVKKDGANLYYSEVNRALRISKLQVEQIFEALLKLNLVEVYSDWVHGSYATLTNKGRDYVLGNKYARA